MLPETFYTYSFVDAPPAVKWARDLYNTVALADGSVIGFIMPQSHFDNLCTAFGLDKLRDDKRFSDVAQRNLNQRALMSEIAQVCGRMTVMEFIAVTRQYDLPFAPVNTVEQFMDDPQVIHNETFVEFDHESLGRIKLLNSFARLSETPINARALPPEIGEHTVDILLSLGIDAEEIARLKSEKAIA